MNDCLGIGLNCSDYNFTFTIIDFLTIIGLFFTGYQLIKPVHKLRLNYYNLFRYWILWFCGIAGICALVPIILKFIPGKAIPVVGYDIFWNFLGLIIVLITGITAFVQANKPIKKVKDINRLKEIIKFYLGQSNEEISALGSEFGYFIGDVVKKVDKDDGDAYAVLLLCKNKRLIENIIINNISSFNELLITYSDRKPTQNNDIENLHKDFVKLVIDESLGNNDSILSREIKGEIYEGINSGKGIISQTIFNNFKFVHDYDLLNRDGYNKLYLNYDISKTYGDNYIKFWNLCLESFFGGTIDGGQDYYKDICGGLCKFAGFKGILYNKIIDGDLSADVLFHLQVKLSSKFEKNIMESKMDNSFYYKIGEGGFYPINSPKDFIEAVSWGCYMCLESVAQVNETAENTETIRHYCNILYGMRIKHGGEVMEAIWDNIRNLVLGQIRYMNSHGKYPSMTRVFFHIFGPDIFYKSTDINEKEKKFILDALKIISTSLESFYDGCFRNFSKNDNENLDLDLQENRNKKVQEILDNFLPNYMLYSYEDKTLTYYSLWGIEKSVLDLKELKNDKIVILNKNKKQCEQQ